MMTARKAAPKNPSNPQIDLWDLASFSAVSLLVALIAVLLARSSWKKTVGSAHVRVGPGDDWLSHLSVGNTYAIIVVVGIIVLLGLIRGLRRDAITSIRTLICEKKAIVVYVSFTVGVLGGAAVRFLVGGLSISGFATGSAPIVAGILVGVIVNGIDDSGQVPWHRQVAVTYLLIGSLATALGTIDAPPGWFFSACFVVICGSLAASVCLAADIVVSKTARPTAGVP